MRKAKKKVHPMPKLGWQDTLLYWTGIVLCGVGSIAALALQRLVRQDTAYLHPDVVATTPVGAEIHYLWLSLWMVTMGCIIFDIYRKRYPVFGRKDIKYGPPTYPRIFPLLMKDPPKYWESPMKVAAQKRSRSILIGVMSKWLVVSLLLYPASIYQRADLYSNGSIVTYDAGNQQETEYRSADVDTVQVRITSRRSKGSTRRSCYLELVIQTKDGEWMCFRTTEFRGDLEYALREILEYLEMMEDVCPITLSGGQNINRLIAYYDMTEAEIDLLYKIF